MAATATVPSIELFGRNSTDDRAVAAPRHADTPTTCCRSMLPQQRSTYAAADRDSEIGTSRLKIKLSLIFNPWW
jgi:hypothetical protein